MNSVNSDEVSSSRTHRHCLAGPHINVEPKNGNRGDDEDTSQSSEE
jgi:hypothetical protein